MNHAFGDARRDVQNPEVVALGVSGRTGRVSMLPDLLAPDLKVVFVGTSVATASAARGHYYAGPRNQFWRLLAESGLTGGQLLGPEDDVTLPSFGIGLTDLVKGRAASSDSLLAADDYDVSGFIDRIAEHGSRIIAFNGLAAATVVGRFLRRGRPALGLAPWRVGRSDVFVLPSSSGAACDPRGWAPKARKADWWIELGRLSAKG